MLKRLYGKEDVPQEVADQLAEMVFSAPTSILLYVIGLIIAAPTFWWCSHDFWIAVAAVTSILLNLSRIAVVFFFKQRNRDGDWARSTTRTKPTCARYAGFCHWWLPLTEPGQYSWPGLSSWGKRLQSRSQ